MYSLLLTFKPKTHANLRFHSNLEQARNRYIGQHGKLQKTTGDKKAHSFVLQFLQAMEASIAHALNVASDAFNMTDTSNTSRSIQVTTGGTSWSFSYWAVEAPANTTTYGIQIGTGTTAPANTDHTIETIINNGVSSGQMQWGSCGVCTCAIVGSNVDLVISRAFSNSSGGTITLREIGLTGYMSNSAGPYVFLFAHDAVNQAVNTAQTATVTYMMRTTV